MATPYEFLIDTFETERLKTLSVWAQFGDHDLRIRPHETDDRGRNLHEQMVHQCMSENLWFCKILGIDVGAPPLPEQETRAGFVERYAADAGARVEALRQQSAAWWEEPVAFFEVGRSRAWVMTRRIAHSAHHRGQLTYMLRQLGRTLHSTYGPTADTGGLPADDAPTIYAYPDVDAVLEATAQGLTPANLPGPPSKPVTERPAK